MQITVDIHEETGLVLREFVGEGQCDGHDFELCSAIPSHSFYIAVDGKAYVVNAADIIQAVIAEHIKTQTEIVDDPA